MKYPGRVIRAGEQDPSIVKALKEKLNAMLAIQDDPTLRLDPANPQFGPKMKRVVQLFQARHVDASGLPLKQDGEIGSLTWAALFGNEAVSRSDRSSSELLTEALRVAAAEEAKKVREVPRNSNRGPEVEAYLRSVGVGPGHAWCCAFVYWCLDEAARALGRANPMVRTAGCLTHWQEAPSRGARRIFKRRAVDDPALIEPGMIFIMDYGGGLGHTGFVERRAGGLLNTLEGNTDASRSREGGGVYRLTRKVMDINKGFLDYSRA